MYTYIYILYSYTLMKDMSSILAKFVRFSTPWFKYRWARYLVLGIDKGPFPNLQM